MKVLPVVLAVLGLVASAVGCNRPGVVPESSLRDSDGSPLDDGHAETEPPTADAGPLEPAPLDAGLSADAAAATPAEADAGASTLSSNADAAIPEPAAPEPPITSTRYPADAVHSPITASVVARLTEIARDRTEDELRVFMKLGASDVVDFRNLHCFGADEGSPYVIDLGEHEHLRETLDFFRAGDARGRNPFRRRSEAAKVGRSAVWAARGGLSPIRREVRAISPAWALVAFGGNDLNLGSSARTAIWGFEEHMNELLDQVISEGVVPIVLGAPPRNDSADAVRWSPTYNALLRGLAEVRQVPFVDLWLASADLPNRGVGSDGVHGTGYRDERRRSQPCVLTEEGLGYHYNLRNLLSLEALDRARRAVMFSTSPDTATLGPVAGRGTSGDPFVIDTLPFTHLADTSTSSQRAIDRYPGCDEDADESGPELLYRLVLDEPRPIRALVFAHGETEVDLHLLPEGGDPGECLARDDRIFQGTLAAGTYLLSVDTPVSRRGTVRAGEYFLLVVPCEPDDRACRRTYGEPPAAAEPEEEPD